jgi:4-aminobutyrate aminotransferase / (S)-3-amino-2-methylpropionate transaminase / 5-aminovalerate transaminase
MTPAARPALVEGPQNDSLTPFKPGPLSSAMYEEETGLIAPGLQSIALFSRLAMDRGEGCRLYDVDGGGYLDFAAGIGVASLGHSHPRYVQALQKQVAKLAVGSFTTENRLRFLKRFGSVAPNGLQRVQLYSGGSEAVEAAIRLAKSYTKKNEILGFWGGFHGKTGGVIGLLTDGFKKDLGPMVPGVYSVPFPNPYRCPFGTTGTHDCAAHCLEFLEQTLERNTCGSLALILVEPIQGTAGNVIPAPGFLAGLSKLAKSRGALLLCDEMICGFGRTGKLFGFMHEDVVPDMLTIGKGVASGFPVSGLVASNRVCDAKPFANPSGSSSSYGGNPLASAAVRATLDIILDEGLIENSRKVGAFLLKELQGLQEKHRFIGDVRGRGLMIGVELVSDRRTKQPLDKKITRALFDSALRRGLLSMCYGPVIRINPPLVITEAEAAEGVQKLDEAFSEVSKAFHLG